jgi:endo-1,4-beta-xylanase
MKLKISLLVLATLLTISSCKTAQNKSETAVSLKNAYKENFYIGTAIDTNQINESNVLVTNLISKEFNCISPENCMKSMFIHPQKDEFDFKMSDKYVAFGKKHHMFIHGHTLIWHSQLAPWLTQIKDSVTMSEAMTNQLLGCGK